MSTAVAVRRQNQVGPPLGLLGVVSAGLFLVGLIVPAALTGSFPPLPTASTATIHSYFAEHRGAVRTGAFCQFASSVPLALFAATASTRLRNLGIRAPGATIAFTGGVLASMFLAVSGLLSWVLSRPETVTDALLVHVLQDLSFATGGPACVVTLGLLVAGIAVPSLIVGLLPRALAIVGLVIAGVAEFCTVSLAADHVAYLLPVARFPALIWLVAVGFLLPVRRPVRSAA